MGIPNLNQSARTTLGAKLVLSASYFEASAAELIGSEGAKLQKLLAGVSTGSVSVKALTTINKDIRYTLAALSTLEGAIVKKIGIGTTLHNQTGW